MSAASWTEAGARAALAAQRGEHVQVMERLRGELRRLQSEMAEEAALLAEREVGIWTARSAAARRELSDYLREASDGIAQAIRAVPDGVEAWEASQAQQWRLAMLCDRHPNEFVAEPLIKGDPFVRAERRESLQRAARRQIQRTSNSVAQRILDRAIQKALAAGSGVHLTLPNGEVVDVPADRIQAMAQARVFHRVAKP